jgi:type IV secretory pathway VirB10-like protein
MKHALITIATVGILAPTAWVAEANAQQMSPGPAPSQAYTRSQMAPTQAYAQRRVRRSARRAPAAAASARTAYAAAPAGTARRAPAAAAPAGTANGPGQAYAQGHYVWPASPGPKKRGDMCVKDVDALRGYGFMEPCKK